MARLWASSVISRRPANSDHLPGVPTDVSLRRVAFVCFISSGAIAD